MHDPICPVEDADDIAAVAPCTYERAASAGHTVADAQPGLVHDLLTRHIHHLA